MIDFHAHLDLYPDPTSVARECTRREMYVLSVTTTPSAWIGTSALAGEDSRIRTALGLHPELAAQRRSELAMFDRLLPTTRYVGEVGLDGSPQLADSWDAQVRVFEHVLAACSSAGGKILSIHSRRAELEVLTRLEAAPTAGTAVLHWFSGSLLTLDRACAYGCWFSVGPQMLRGKKGRSLVAAMPRDRILTETDGPFAVHEGRAAMPWDVQDALLELGRIWGLSTGEATEQVHHNLRALLRSTTPSLPHARGQVE
jgi:TatD DNase family protein